MFTANRYHGVDVCPLLSDTPDPRVTDCTNVNHREIARIRREATNARQAQEQEQAYIARLQRTLFSRLR